MKKLTPTQISVAKQLIDTVIKLTGDCPYTGKYYAGMEGEGYLRLVDNINDAHKMNAYTSKDVVSSLCTHARYCYGGSFETVTIVN